MAGQIGETLRLLKRIAKSPTRAIELVQDNRGKAVKLIADNKKTFSLNRPVSEWLLLTFGNISLMITGFAQNT